MSGSELLNILRAYTTADYGTTEFIQNLLLKLMMKSSILTARGIILYRTIIYN